MVVAKVEVPTTVRVPLEVKEDVEVIVPNVAFPPVSVEMMPVTALKELAKRLVEVALVKVAFVAVRLVMIAVTALRRVAKKLLQELLSIHSMYLQVLSLT